MWGVVRAVRQFFCWHTAEYRKGPTQWRRGLREWSEFPRCTKCKKVNYGPRRRAEAIG